MAFRFRLLWLVVFFVAVALLFFHRLADRDLWSSHEARAAQDAQTILDDGAWGLPRQFDGEPELQKPPLYYWLVAVLAWCRGGRVDAWAVRLPAALSALGCVLFVWWMCRRRGRPVAALVSAAVLATALHFTWLARVGRIDMPLTLAVTVAVGGLYLAALPPLAPVLGGEGSGVRGAACGLAGLLQRRPAKPQAAKELRPLFAYLAAAAAVLLKGPIGFVLPAAVLTVHLLAEGGRRVRLARLGLWWGLPLVAVVALPWFFWADARTQGEMFRVFIWHHNFERGFDASGGLREHPWWFYGPQFALDFLPWSPFLAAAAWYLFRGGRWRQDAEARLGLVWFVAVGLLLSCARFKRSDYLLPAYPGAALFLGCAAERWYRQTRLVRLPPAAFGVMLTGCVAGWLIYVQVYLPRVEPQYEVKRFAAAIRRLAPAPEPVLLFRTEHHALAFHVGRPLQILVQWPDLETWATGAKPGYVVMPPGSYAELEKELPSWRSLEKVLCNTELSGGHHDKPLVLLRTRLPNDSTDARASQAAADRVRAAQRPAPGPQ
jgi:4-amino-4-deoxy-L-arabinose transferase-like glycosyltransferase